jgi:hypothetical protein
LLGAGRGAKWDVFALASWINFIHGGAQPCGDPGEIRSRLLEASLNGDWKVPGMGAAWQCRAEAPDDICAFAAAKGIELQVTIRLMDERASGLSSWRASWRQFLRACNLLQFLPGSVWITTQGLREGRFGSMLDREAAQEQDGLQEFLMDVLDEKARVLVRELRAQGFPLPEPGYELVHNDGAIYGMAELAWTEQRVLVLAEQQMEWSVAAETAGWRVFQAASDTAQTVGSALAEVKA